MNNETKEPIKSTFNKDIRENKNYRDFLSHLGIDPSDFEDEYEIEIDDYSNS